MGRGQELGYRDNNTEPSWVVWLSWMRTSYVVHTPEK